MLQDVRVILKLYATSPPHRTYFITFSKEFVTPKRLRMKGEKKRFRKKHQGSPTFKKWKNSKEKIRKCGKSHRSQRMRKFHGGSG